MHARDVIAPFAVPADRIPAALGVDLAAGLPDDDVRRRRARFGPNRLTPFRPRTAGAILVAQFRSLIVAFLLAAALLSAVTAEWMEAAAIAVVIGLNAAIGFVSELRAVRSMEALRRLGVTTVHVRRGGVVTRLPAEELVPGDVVLVEAGDVIAADLRIVSASKLQADESTLTGESLPVDKDPAAVPADAPLAERTGMLHRGSAITRGSAEGVVCATGMRTELGGISAMVGTDPEDDLTPLERRLERLGRRLVWLTIVVAVVVAALGLLAGTKPVLIVKTAIALAVAAVPEGLPIVATLALARGMWRMARRNAIVKRLSAVETLGATTVILTDKTGTLTENRMAVRSVVTAAGSAELETTASGARGAIRRDGAPVDPSSDPELRALLEVGALCTNASWTPSGVATDPEIIGEPMEVALLAAAVQAGLDPAALATAMPELEEIAFDPSVNMMATRHRSGEAVRLLVKGAPEAVLDACRRVRVGRGDRDLDASDREAWTARNRELADHGLRLLACAERRDTDPDAAPFRDLTLLGLTALADPPRTDVREAIAACRAAGVRVVMVTGDQASTARFVASAVGLDGAGPVVTGRELAAAAGQPDEVRDRMLDAAVFARVSPAQKLDLLGLFRARGEIVAMTGDGVNDAPALRAADIGIAMGRRGTDVAREAADMVLRDDAFGSIVAAIAQGRVIFDNIRTFIRYLVSCNLSEILVVLLGVTAGTPLPVLPLQILFLNLVTDVFPALALGLGAGDAAVLRRPPRDPAEPVLARRHWLGIVAFGVLIACATLGALLIGLRLLGLDETRAVTMSFLTLALAQLWHVFDMRPRGSRLLDNEITRNRAVWIALALCLGLVVLAVRAPMLAAPLRAVDPGPRGWLVVLGMSTLPVLLGQAWLSLARPRADARTAPID